MNDSGFTKRENQIIKLLLEGKSNKQIAMALGISEGTVEFHLTSIYSKLGVSSRVEAILLLDRQRVSPDRPMPANSGTTPGLGHENQGETPGALQAGSGYDGNRQREPVKRKVMTGKKNPALRNFALPVIIVIAAALILIFTAYFYLSMPRTWKGYAKECEYPDRSTVGQAIGRSNASGDRVHGQFGAASSAPWPAVAGQVVYENISTPAVEQLYLKLYYSKNSPASVPILVYLDGEKTPRASIYPLDLKDWNRLSWTDPVFLGSVGSGVHTLTFSTVGQQYGVADLDEFVLSAGSP
jgi:DNA-binding CsgD family transcriptional regulator